MQQKSSYIESVVDENIPHLIYFSRPLTFCPYGATWNRTSFELPIFCPDGVTRQISCNPHPVDIMTITTNNHETLLLLRTKSSSNPIRFEKNSCLYSYTTMI